MLRSETRKTTRLSINEVYQSLQGEGLLVGTPAIFVRFQGCNLRCPWCDQKEALEFGKENYTIDTLLEEVRKHSPKHVVITGGEPMAHEGLYPLASALLEEGYTVQIETNGTLWVKGLETLDLHITCSPKWAGGWFVHPKVLEKASEIKFVVDHMLTLDVLLKQEFERHLREGKMVLQPESNKQEFLTKAIQIQQKLLEKGYIVRVIPQMHKVFGLR